MHRSGLVQRVLLCALWLVAVPGYPAAPADDATFGIALPALRALAARLAAVERQMGFVAFAVTDYPSVFALGDVHKKLRFSAEERAALSALFALDARRFGFTGPRASEDLDAAMPRSRLVKTRGSAVLVYPAAAELVRRLQDAGCKRLIVTSGARGIPKQTLLFVRKALRVGFAQAARSVAPPGYSFHATGDIDVGDADAGADVNFSERFAGTGTYACIAALPGVRWRYPKGNAANVIYEPWHLAVP